MKTLCALVVCAAFVYVKAQDFSDEKFAATATACKEEVGGSDSDLEAVMQHKTATTIEGKCLRSCVMKKFEFMNADGKLSKDIGYAYVKIKAAGDEEKEKLGIALVDECAAIEVSDDHCEAAEVYGECIRTQVEEKGLSVL